MITPLSQMLDNIMSYQYEFHGMTVKIDNIGHPTNFRYQVFDASGKLRAYSEYSYSSRWNCEYSAEEYILLIERLSREQTPA